MPERLFIGVDGGATNCRARIADATGKVLGEARIRSAANIAARKPAVVAKLILRAVRQAARDSRVAEARWKNASVGMGLAGGDVKGAVRELKAALKDEGYFRKVDVRTDAYATWLGAFGGADGAILIFGTGSCGLAVVGGSESYVSGYGSQISDEASAQWIGRMAIRRSLWARDGRIDRTPLANVVLARFNDSPEEIVTFAAKATASDFGGFAPLVFDHARSGDPLAVAIISEAAADAERMIARLLDLGARSVYLHGGIAEQLAKWLRPETRKRLKMPMNVEATALEGAVLLARNISRTRERKAGAA
jgi:glucosamine kinase